jgi:hypothetical protein
LQKDSAARGSSMAQRSLMVWNCQLCLHLHALREQQRHKPYALSACAQASCRSCHTAASSA